MMKVDREESLKRHEAAIKEKTEIFKQEVSIFKLIQLFIVDEQIKNRKRSAEK
jgi:hypothetical protein